MRGMYLTYLFGVGILLAQCSGANFTSRSFVKRGGGGGGGGGGERPEASGDVVAGSVGENSGKTPEDGEGEDEYDDPADMPVWVNTPALTCRWLESPSAREAWFACAVPKSPSGAVVAEIDTWRLIDAYGAEIAQAVRTSTPAEATFAASAEVVPGASVFLEGRDIGEGGASGPVQAVSVELVSALPALGEPTLHDCLVDETKEVNGCLVDSGVLEQEPAVAEPQHPRFEYQSVAYYLSGTTESCTDVCALYGGTHDATISVIGDAGTDESCRAVLQGLLADPTIAVSNTSGPAGVGCHVDGSSGLRFGPPATTQGARIGGTRRACACNG